MTSFRPSKKYRQERIMYYNEIEKKTPWVKPLGLMWIHQSYFLTNFNWFKNDRINRKLVSGEVYKLLFRAVKRKFNSRHHNIVIPKIPNILTISISTIDWKRTESEWSRFSNPSPPPPFAFPLPFWKNVAAPWSQFLILFLFRVKSWAEYWAGTIYWRDNTGSWS